MHQLVSARRVLATASAVTLAAALPAVGAGTTWAQEAAPTTGTAATTTATAEATPSGPGTVHEAPAADPMATPAADPMTAPAADAAATCGPAAEQIGAVQGTGAESPMAGQTVTVAGTVVGDFQDGGFRGYYLQDAGDDNDQTSDGIFVYAPDGTAVSAGDVVSVTGKVSEYNGMTQISADQTESCGTAELPAPVPLTLPVDSLDDLEQYEGMRVTLDQDVVINEAYNFDRFGEIRVGSTRHHTPTNLHAPGSAEAKQLADFNARDSITIDDGVSAQNPDPLRHPDGKPFTADHRFRIGDTLAGVTGVLDWRFDLWRIQPTAPAQHTETNPRPQAPQPVGTLTVASANVLNYFTTLSSQDPDARGAETEAEFRRQEDKIVAELAAMDADVVGLMEIENNGTAVQALVDALNAKVGAGTYAAVDTGVVGTDAITTALIYKPAKVEPVGAHNVLDESVDPAFDTTKNRPALAQVFHDKASGKDLTISVNHLKSKGSSCAEAGDPEDPNGQGNCNGTRVKAATALASWLSTDPELSATTGQLIIGDLNSYAKEDPITALAEAGFADQVARFAGAEAYSYVFDGQAGYLDHALASAGLAPFVTEVAEWHNNADEPDVLDYTMGFKKPAQQDAYAPDAYRASDHDPVLIGLDLSGNTAPAPEAGSGSLDLGSLGSTGSSGSAGSAGSADSLDTGALGSLAGILGSTRQSASE